LGEFVSKIVVRLRVSIALVAAAVLFGTFGAGHSAAVAPNYDRVLFATDFDAGPLVYAPDDPSSPSAWTDTTGTGVSRTTAAAHNGSYGLRIANGTGQYSIITKKLAQPQQDSSTSFWVRVSGVAGVQELAEARDGTAMKQMWAIFYDGSQGAFWFFPRTESSASAIYTGAGSAPRGSWVKVEVQYTATATGGARLFVNGQTQPDWAVSGDYRRSGDLQKVDLWNDVANTADFDEVTIAAPLNAPGAPTGLVAAAGNGSARLNWMAPADGGAPITGYTIATFRNGTAQPLIDTGSTATTFTVPNLTNGSSYTFTVAATNRVGTGPASATSAAVTPTSAGLPGAPLNVHAAAGDGSVALDWTAPASNGGAQITSYTITPSLNGVAQAPVETGSAATTYVVQGLTNGSTYTFRVAATNGVGTGPDSAPSPGATPASRYSNVLFATDFDAGPLVFDPVNAGSPTAWTDTTGLGAVRSTAAAHNGSYGLRIANGTGQYSIITKKLAQPQPDTSVSFWVRVSSAAGVQEVSEARERTAMNQMWSLFYDGSQGAFWFFPRSETGGAAIYTGAHSANVGSWVKVEIQYTATATGGARIFLNGQTQPSWAASGDYRRSGDLQKVDLWNDAANAIDFDEVTIAASVGVPGVPQGLSATSGNGSAQLTWSAPGSDGGAPITGYTIVPSRNGTAQAPIATGSAATSYTVNGLTNGSSYTFTVAATNSVGTGAASAPSAAVTPTAAGLPGAPTGVSAVPENRAATVTWTAPANDGGASITSYRITPYLDGSPQTPVQTSSAATTYRITGLVNGGNYAFRVAATNGAGTGADSALSATVVPTSSYIHTAFSDGFETGSWTAWAEPIGTGTATVVPAAAHSGSFGLRFANATGNYAIIMKSLPLAQRDSSTGFWVRIGSAAGVQELADARDASASESMWALFYDGSRRGFLFYPRSATGATEIFTGANSVPVGSWAHVEIEYTATAAGGARLYVDGTTRPEWSVSGDYRRAADLQRVQLWNDGPNTVDFDDVVVAAP
jgi:titin